MGREGMGALRRLSVALYNGNDFLFLASLHAFCRAAGKHPAIGFVVPMACTRTSGTGAREAAQLLRTQHYTPAPHVAWPVTKNDCPSENGRRSAKTLDNGHNEAPLAHQKCQYETNPPSINYIGTIAAASAVGTGIQAIPAGTTPVSYTHLTLPTTPYV